MAKKLGIALYIVFFVLIIPSLFYIIHTSTSNLYSQTITLSDRKVIYELPYPGILPDHPLYTVKMVRDRLLDWATRDNLKKSELFLLFSDKRAAMAIELAAKGKSKLAISTLSKGERYFENIPELLKKEKSQGGAIPDALKHRVKLSNDKHREIIDSLAKNLPQGEPGLAVLVELNNSIKKSLDSL